MEARSDVIAGHILNELDESFREARSYPLSQLPVICDQLMSWVLDRIRVATVQLICGDEQQTGPFVESEQIWALSRKILLYGPERPFTAQVFIKIVDEQINSAIQPQIADSGAISQLLFLKRGRSGP